MLLLNTELLLYQSSFTGLYFNYFDKLALYEPQKGSCLQYIPLEET